MTAKAVWIAGLSGLVVLSAVGLYRMLPAMETDLKASIDQALTVKGLTQVKADVSGQSVTLHATTETSEAKAQLMLAKATLAAVSMNAPVLPGGALVNSPISDIQVVDGVRATAHLANVSPPVPAYNDHSALPTTTPPITAPIEIIHGDGATVVASISPGDGPRVAGDSALEASTQVARSCDQDLDAVVGQRQLSYISGTYDLTPESQRLIDDVYKVVAACPVQVRLTVSGYTDNGGDGLVNQTISQAKAQAAADALVKRGLPANRVIVRGFGGALPVADNATSEGRARNRRVVFTVNAS
ncbi:Outer membrane protein A [Asticcacaulis sp. MM231]|uniref:OmpA family protein n=1 Tax=Asticcacaulis sp. MM231 TaxID=3157666 RepID=UPI0032D579AD